MAIKFKKLHPEAVLPKRANAFDAGMDMTAVSEKVTDAYIEYDTGVAVEIPPGYVGFLFPRSSITKTGLMLGNSVGVVDAGFRGSVTFRFKDVNRHLTKYKVGDRIGQLVIVPILLHDGKFVEELSDTARGTGGYGSSGT